MYIYIYIHTFIVCLFICLFICLAASLRTFVIKANRVAALVLLNLKVIFLCQK